MHRMVIISYEGIPRVPASCTNNVIIENMNADKRINPIPIHLHATERINKNEK